MKHRFRALLVVLFGCTLGLVAPLLADTVPFYTSVDATYTGGTHPFLGTGSEAIQATSFACVDSASPFAAKSCSLTNITVSQSSLFSKKLVSPPNGEAGLGLTNDPNHEISSSGFVRLDFSGFTGNTFSVEIQSVQAGESFTLYQGTGSSLAGTTIIGTTHTGPGTGPGNAVFDLTFTLGTTGSKLNSLYVQGGGTAGGENVTVASITSSVPEPGSLVLFGSGLLSAAAVIRRKSFLPPQ